MWQGNLELIYTQKNLATQINHVYATAPLKVQRPFYPEGKNLCHTVILHKVEKSQNSRKEDSSLKSVTP